MAAHSLTDRQKEMLRSIALELQNGTVKTDWIIIPDRGEIVDINGLTGTLSERIWSDITEADLDDFIDAGLFRFKGSRSYNLSVPKITEAIKSNFSEDNEQQSLTNSVNQMIFAPIFGSPSPSSQYKADVFMLMPFHKSFRPIYFEHIKPAVESLNLMVKRKQMYRKVSENTYRAN